MIYIYEKEKFIIDLNYTLENFQPHFMSGWKETYKVYDKKFNHPIWDDLILDSNGFQGALREMTVEETKISGKVPLYDGEYLDENNKLIIVDKPVEMLKPQWDTETNTWIESATQQEIEEYINLENLKYVNSEIEATNKFDLLNYRNLITSKGDSLEDMDAYRLQMLSIQYDLVNAPVKKTRMSKAKTVATFDLNSITKNMPAKPEALIAKYAYLR